MGMMEKHLLAMDTLLIAFSVLFFLASIVMGFVMVRDYKRYEADGCGAEAGVSDMLGNERTYVCLFVAVTVMFLIDLWLLM